MAITNIDQLANSVANSNQKFLIDKVSIPGQLAGAYTSAFRATGTPAQGSIPAANAVCNSATLGAITFTNQTAPVYNYIAYANLAALNSATNYEIHDRLCHMGGLNGTLLTSQTVGLDVSTIGVSADRIGRTDYSELNWWMEFYTAVGSTAANATINVTSDTATTFNLTAVPVTSLAAGRVINLISLIPTANQASKIRGINSVILSASTGTAGNFGFTCTRPMTTLPTFVVNKSETFDWAQLGMPLVPNDACLTFMVLCTTTSSGNVRGFVKIAIG